MTNIKLEDLPKAVSENQISKEEAVNIIWEELYTNPKKYGLRHFTEDQKSDFLLGMHRIFTRIFEKFIPGSVSFSTYLTGFVSNYKNSFLHQQFIREHERRSITTLLKSETEEKSLATYVKIPECETESENEETKTFSDITEKKTCGMEQRHQKVAELTALVLLMKACRDIDDEVINKVSKFTGVDKSLLFEKIQLLKESMSRKDTNNQNLIARRNNAFFFHRKYMQEMLAPTYSAEKNQDTLKSRYEKQTRKWLLHNQELAVRSNTPSNEEIAKIIGLKPRTVSFYINHAKNRNNLRKFQELRNEAENANHKGEEAAEQETKNDFIDE